MTLSLPVAAASAHALRGLCDGAVFLPGDDGYDAARLPWNVAVDQRPAAVAYPATVGHVQDVVRAARAAGLRVAPQSTGHNAGPLVAQGLDDVVVVRTSLMRGVSVDPERRRARVEGGALWLDATEPAGDHGLAALHGSSPDVGIAGYSLGGGLGWYARTLGLATNSITAVELVTASGEHVRVDSGRDPELFWALRGGGGSFGVVTALELRLYPIETAYAGLLVWDVREAETVLRRWAQWAPGAPDEVATAFRVLNVPDVPDVPDVVRGRSLTVVDGAVLGPDERGNELLAGLRDLAPELDTFGRVPARSLVRLHMDPEGPTPAVSDSAMLRELPDAAIAAFLAQVGPGSTSSLLVSELRQLGGAVGRAAVGGGALDRLEGAFALFASAMALTPEMAARGHQDATALTTALRPWTHERWYLNFAENATDARTGYDDRTWRRLVAARASADPEGLFVANHRIPAPVECPDLAAAKPPA